MTADELDLLDWKRHILAIYADIRSSVGPAAAHARWRTKRDDLFRTHPQSPLPQESRASFPGVPYFPYDPELRVLAEVEPVEPSPTQIGSSGEESIAFHRF